MKISARNQLKGKVTAVKTGATTSHIAIDIGGGNTVTASITNEAVADLGLKEVMTSWRSSRPPTLWSRSRLRGLGPRTVCTGCGIVGADARPNAGAATAGESDRGAMAKLNAPPRRLPKWVARPARPGAASWASGGTAEASFASNLKRKCRPCEAAYRASISEPRDALRSAGTAPLCSMFKRGLCLA
jgi:molybdopterin-binding protein